MCDCDCKDLCTCTCPCPCPPSFCNTVSAEAVAFTKCGFPITATSSASACSNVGFEDAWIKAYDLAKETAKETAQTEANLVDTTVDIVKHCVNVVGPTGPQGPPGPTIPTNFSNFQNIYEFNDFQSLNSFQLPTPGPLDPKQIEIRTIIDNSILLGNNNAIHGSVLCNVVDKLGNIYLGGKFKYVTSVNGSIVQGASGIVMWSPSTQTWSPLGLGIEITISSYTASVETLALDLNGNLFVGGFFDSVKQPNGSILLANCVAKWSPSSKTWSTLGNGSVTATSTNNGVNSIVYALAVDLNNNVYVGGIFSTVFSVISGVTTFTILNNIAYYNTTTNSWSGLGNGTNSVTPTNNGVSSSTTSSGGAVYALLLQKNGNLVVGGNFAYSEYATGPTTSNNIFTNNISYWNVTLNQWQAFGSSVSSTTNGVGNNLPNDGTLVPVKALTQDNNGNLYVGGNFDYAFNSDGTMNTFAKNIVLWSPISSITNFTEGTWSSLVEGISSNVKALYFDLSNNILYISSSGIAKSSIYNNNVTISLGLMQWDGYLFTGVGTTRDPDSIIKINNLLLVCSGNNCYFVIPGSNYILNTNGEKLPVGFNPLLPCGLVYDSTLSKWKLYYQQFANSVFK